MTTEVETERNIALESASPVSVAQGRGVPVLRQLNFDFPLATRADWIVKRPWLTHWLNAYTLIVPEGEKFIIRFTRRYAKSLPPETSRQVAGLLGQEALHSREHEKFWINLSRQGYRFRAFNRFCNWLLYDFLEGIIPRIVGLSTASAIEHINALLAEVALRERVLDEADPVMKELFEWHHAEEIEHKEVVFNVLQAVAPSYALRILGLAIACSSFLGLLVINTFLLSVQDGKMFHPRFWWDGLRYWLFKDKFLFCLASAFVQYCRPSFHPADIDSDHLAEEVLSRYKNTPVERRQTIPTGEVLS